MLPLPADLILLLLCIGSRSNEIETEKISKRDKARKEKARLSETIAGVLSCEQWDSAKIRWGKSVHQKKPKKWWQTKVKEQNFLDCSASTEMICWCAFTHSRGLPFQCMHALIKISFKMQRHLWLMSVADSAPYPVTPALGQLSPTDSFYYAWPVGEMTRDILLTQRDGQILTAAS